jgi:hypothetical protein
MYIHALDRWIYGAQKIGELAGIFDEHGNVDIQRTDYALRMGYIDAEKFGRRWRSTPRRILKPATSSTTATGKTVQREAAQLDTS